MQPESSPNHSYNFIYYNCVVIVFFDVMYFV